ncbi:hypothetical protein SERLA73DRAFT_174713, partial [Serpula lacrymans var. lacrymans S7.3]
MARADRDILGWTLNSKCVALRSKCKKSLLSIERSSPVISWIDTPLSKILVVYLFSLSQSGPLQPTTDYVGMVTIFVFYEFYVKSIVINWGPNGCP